MYFGRGWRLASDVKYVVLQCRLVRIFSQLMVQFVCVVSKPSTPFVAQARGGGVRPYDRERGSAHDRTRAAAQGKSRALTVTSPVGLLSIGGGGDYGRIWGDCRERGSGITPFVTPSRRGKKVQLQHSVFERWATPDRSKVTSIHCPLWSAGGNRGVEWWDSYSSSFISHFSSHPGAERLSSRIPSHQYGKHPPLQVVTILVGLRLRPLGL